MFLRSQNNTVYFYVKPFGNNIKFNLTQAAFWLFYISLIQVYLIQTEKAYLIIF